MTRPRLTARGRAIVECLWIAVGGAAITAGWYLALVAGMSRG